jgi:hypothetical protein
VHIADDCLHAARLICSKRLASAGHEVVARVSAIPATYPLPGSPKEWLFCIDGSTPKTWKEP